MEQSICCFAQWIEIWQKLVCIVGSSENKIPVWRKLRTVKFFYKIAGFVSNLPGTRTGQIIPGQGEFGK